MTPNTQLLRTVIFSAIILSVFSLSCRKNDIPSIEPAKIIATDPTVMAKFFNMPANTDLSIVRVANDLRKGDAKAHFITRLMQNNGVPRWDKVFYSNGNTKSKGNRESTSSTDSSGQGLFFIPLQSEITKEVKSYITCYKHNDSQYTYRMYNRDSLNNIHPGNDTSKQRLYNTQLVFGYFEKQINNKDSIYITSPYKTYIKHANLKFNEVITGGRISGGDEECTVTYSITESADERAPDFQRNSSSTRTSYITINIAISCRAGSGSGATGGDAEGTRGGSWSAGAGGPSYGPGNYTGGWWDFGTGWPYTNNTTPDPYQDPTWYYWWTGGGYNTPINNEYIPDYYDYALPPFTWTFAADDGSTFTSPFHDLEPAFQFDLSDNYELLYPRFTNMVNNLKTFVKGNPKVLSALQRWSGFSKQQILDHLTMGQGPKIKVEKMTGRYAYYDKKAADNILHVRQSYVLGLEQAFLEKTQEATAFLLAVSILHEYIHLGTTHNNISEGKYEFGSGFEIDAFNVIVEDDNAGNVVIKFSEYF